MKDRMIRFIDCHVPTETCNLRCHYCYITQNRQFEKELTDLGHSPQEIRKALSKKRLGGTCFLNFCAGGETLLSEEILPVIREILEEGHYVQIVTNGTMKKRFEEICLWPELLRERLFIKFSFHFLELKRLGLLTQFFDSVKKVREVGCSISLEITPSDELVSYIDEVKEISQQYVGAWPHITVARNEKVKSFEILSQYDRKKYEDVWGTFDSEMFRVKMQLLSEKREEYCYGGEWTFYLHLGSGDLKQCYRGAIIDNIYEDIDRPLRFKPIGKGCPERYCYNGHAWLTLGSIPGMNLPSYAAMRDRECADGSRWLQPKVAEFFSQKLETAHTVYGEKQRCKAVLFGDSICQGYRTEVEKKLNGIVDVCYYGENARFSTFLLRYISEWANKLGVGSDIDIVHFNVGLWDILRLDGDEPLVSLEVYKENLTRICKEMRYVFPNAKIIFATTTSINESEAEYTFLRLNSDINAYNEIACEVMHEQGVIINDLYSIAAEFEKDMYADFTHFNEEGFDRLANAVATIIFRETNQLCSWNDKIKNIVRDIDICMNPQPLFAKRIIIYGAGTYGKNAVETLKKNHIEPYVICDASPKKQNTTLCGIEVISPQQYKMEKAKKNNDILLIAIKDAKIVESVVEEFMNVSGLTICTIAVLQVFNF